MSIKPTEVDVLEEWKIPEYSNLNIWIVKFSSCQDIPSLISSVFQDGK